MPPSTVPRYPVGQSYAHHDCPAKGLKVPEAQGTQTSDLAPTFTLPLPGGHREHAVAPGCAEKEPAAQGTHEEIEAAPGSGLKLPAGQGLQLVGDVSPEGAPYVPAAQGNEVPPMQKAPGEHCWQEAAPEPE